MTRANTKPVSKIDYSQFSPKRNMSTPNLISLLRILLIPLIFWFYLDGKIMAAVAVVAVSGISDAVDGYIARHYNQITTLGKVLDPLADKLTQIALAVCLCTSFPEIMPLILLLLVKELTMLYWGLRLLKIGRTPISARWWGKLSTTVFYVGVIMIMLWSEILGAVGVTIITNIILIVMLFSMVRYGLLFIAMMRGKA
jgi:cardiolipin synthase (CMP-forming)